MKADELIVALPQDAIRDVTSLCDDIRQKNWKNAISVNMATGIAEFARANSFISQKQALWLSRNADYWHIKKPDELSNIPAATPANSGSNFDKKSKSKVEREADFMKELAARLEAIAADIRCFA